MPIWAIALYVGVISPWRGQMVAASFAITLTSGAFGAVLAALRVIGRMAKRGKTRHPERLSNAVFAVYVASALTCSVLAFPGPWPGITKPSFISLVAGDVVGLLAVGACALAARGAWSLTSSAEPRHPRPRRLVVAVALAIGGTAGWAAIAGVLFGIAAWMPRQW